MLVAARLIRVLATRFCSVLFLNLLGRTCFVYVLFYVNVWRTAPGETIEHISARPFPGPLRSVSMVLVGTGVSLGARGVGASWSSRAVRREAVSQGPDHQYPLCPTT